MAICVVAASLRSVDALVSTKITPLASVVIVCTYFVACPVELSQPQPLGPGCAEVFPVWYTSETAERHWLVARMASEIFALIV